MFTHVMIDGQEVTSRKTIAYTADVDQVTEREWTSILCEFDDANLMQTWAYGAVRWGAGNLSHIVLRNDGQIVAAAQVIITKIPVLGAGLAYVKMGPLWRRRNTGQNIEILRQMLTTLCHTYAMTRGLFLRIYPPGIEDGSGKVRALFDEEGFVRDLSIGIPTTAFIDLSHSLDDLRRSLKPTWRRNLVLAERNDLCIVEGSSGELFDIFAALYKEMLKRKKIVGVVDIRHYQQIQRRLPDGFKMKVMVCEHRGEPIAAIVVPVLGETIPSLLAATGDKGLELRASYLLHWRMLTWLRTQGYRFYDLDALNRDTYPGISQFKLGFAGRLGWEAEYLGQFEYCTSAVSRLCVTMGELLRKGFRTMEFGVNAGTRVFSRKKLL